MGQTSGVSGRCVRAGLGWGSGLVTPAFSGPSSLPRTHPTGRGGSFPTPPTEVAGPLTRIRPPHQAPCFSLRQLSIPEMPCLVGRLRAPRTHVEGKRKVGTIRRMGRKTRDYFALIWVGKLLKRLIISTLSQGVGKRESSSASLGLETGTASVEISLSHSCQ